MTNRLSILTPVGLNAPFLQDTAASVLNAARHLPVGWDLQWVLAMDGEETPSTLQISQLVESTAVVLTRVFLPRSFGPATARNAAAQAADGQILYMLDADDLLLPFALYNIIEAFKHYPLWAASNRYDRISKTGECLGVAEAEISGRTCPGTIRDFFRKHRHAPLPPAQIAVQTPAFWTAGAYPAVEINEDLGLLLALDRHGNGLVTPGSWYAKRVWSGQITHDVDALSPSCRRFEQLVTKRGLL